MNAIEALGWTLISFLWQGALIGLVAALALWALRRRSAKARYAAASAALLAMLVVAVITFAVFLENPPAAPPPAAAFDTPPEAPDSTPPVARSVSAPAPSRGPVPHEFLETLVGLWCAGVSAMMLWSAVGWSAAQRMRFRRRQPAPIDWRWRLERLSMKLGITRRVELYVSELARVPAAIGVFRPVVLLPAAALMNLPVRQLEAILAHELAHIRRHDYFINLVQALVEGLLFYHPAVWWVSNRVREEREHCCDDLAVGICGDPLTYARALESLELIRYADTRTRFAMAATGRSGSLLGRIRRLAGVSAQTSRWPLRTRTFWWIAMLPLFTLAVVLGSSGLTAQPREPRPKPAPPALAAPPATAAAPKPNPAPQPAPAQPLPAPRNNGLLAGLVAAGYGDLSVQEIVQLRQNGIDANYLLGLRNGGWEILPVDALIEWRNNGISPEYARDLRRAGVRDLRYGDVIHLRHQGVSPQDARRWMEAAETAYSTEQLIELRQHGVSPGLIRALREAGAPVDRTHELVEAQQNGLSAADIAAARARGVRPVIRDLIDWKHHRN